jgi:cytochrome c-type biogenesis protein CcmF
MIAELGHFALWLALAVSLVLSVLPLWGSVRARDDWMALSYPLSTVLFVLVVVSYACLTTAFINNDFSVLYVAQHSNSGLPLMYRIAGVWGGHEGSLLLWALMLATWMMAVVLFSKNLPLEMVSRVLSVMGWSAWASCCSRCSPPTPSSACSRAGRRPRPEPAAAGPGHDHPPAHAVHGLRGLLGGVCVCRGRAARRQARCRVGALVAPLDCGGLVFLTIGIALGSWWAYYELGWGGWWFWDPVENASFMPWLVGTALMHSLAVTEKRGAFKSWTVLLAITAFSLSLLGTFLVRSGVLSSVHAFATDPTRGLFILIFLVVVVGASLALFAWRAPPSAVGSALRAAVAKSPAAGQQRDAGGGHGRRAAGHALPAAAGCAGMGKISVGPPYFDAVFVPLMAPVVFLMGVGPLARWKQASLPELAVRLRWAAVVAIVAALAGGWLAGKITLGATLGLLMGWWVVAGVATDLWGRIRPVPGMGLLQRALRLPRATMGMMLAHLGVAVFIFGVTMVNTYQVERDVSMQVGDKTSAGGYDFVFKGVREVRGPNYEAIRGELEILRDGKVETVMHPEKRVYRVQRNPMTEAAIDSGITRDLYVSLGEQVENGAWIVRVYYKPFVNWIWGGCAIMALGGLLAAADRRYRIRTTDGQGHKLPEDRPVPGAEDELGMPQPAHKVATGAAAAANPAA